VQAPVSGRAGAIAATYLYLLATAGPREALWIAGLAARDWKQRICGALNDEAPKDAPAPLDERVAHLRALGQHLGYQARDAVKQVLCLAPADAALARAVDRICADLQHFAGRESQGMVELASALSGQAAPSPPEPPRYGGASGQGAQVLQRLRWEKPADSAFSEAGQAALNALCKRNAGVDRIWDWLNGRRTAEEVWERVQFGDAVPGDVVADYLELLVAEGFAVEVRIPEK
jgi:hypothetical protein